MNYIILFVAAFINIKTVNTLFEDNVSQIKVYYLTYVGENINELLSELYYRNKAGHSYSDINENKIATCDSKYPAVIIDPLVN